jgi:hypothetical protein
MSDIDAALADAPEPWTYLWGLLPGAGYSPIAATTLVMLMVALTGIALALLVALGAFGALLAPVPFVAMAVWALKDEA